MPAMGGGGGGVCDMSVVDMGAIDMMRVCLQVVMCVMCDV